MSPTMASAMSWVSASLTHLVASRPLWSPASSAMRLMRYMWSAMLSGPATFLRTHPVRLVVFSLEHSVRKSTACLGVGTAASTRGLFLFPSPVGSAMPQVLGMRATTAAAMHQRTRLPLQTAVCGRAVTRAPLLVWWSGRPRHAAEVGWRAEDAQQRSWAEDRPVPPPGGCRNDRSSRGALG
eukprot:scaffold1779_cov373-Prasinococcus_capsulatus_cf.AAC.2